uniref:Uncharacterized protein n=1 Tax=Rhizophora mucronata TaxID=61149 RepID=A0A2P2PRQ8_RHIMU
MSLVRLKTEGATPKFKCNQLDILAICSHKASHELLRQTVG